MSLVAGTVVLAVVAVPFMSMKTAFNVPGGADSESTERAAYNLILDKFDGVQSPSSSWPREMTSRAAPTPWSASSQPCPASPQQPLPRSATAGTSPASRSSRPKDRSTTRPRTWSSRSATKSDTLVEGLSLEPTGEAAIGIDQGDALNQALIKYVIVIVLISMVLLVLLFRSILIPVIATVGYLLSLLASFGASTAVFQWGWKFPSSRRLRATR